MAAAAAPAAAALTGLKSDDLHARRHDDALGAVVDDHRLDAVRHLHGVVVGVGADGECGFHCRHVQSPPESAAAGSVT